MSQPQMSPESQKRIIRIAIGLAILIAVMTTGASLLRLQADYWWYTLDAGAGVVFATDLKARATLFLAGLALTLPLFLWNGRKALGASMVFGAAESVPPELAITSLLSWSLQRAGKLLAVLTPVVAIVFAVSLSQNKDSYLLFQNAVPFGKHDPVFGLDYAFYVFQLPFLKAVVVWLLSFAIVNALVIAAVHFGTKAFATLARVPIMVPALRGQASLVGALIFALIGFMIWLGRYDALSEVGPKFTGAGYASLQAVVAKGVVAWIFWIGAIAAIATTRVGKPLSALVGFGVLAGLVFVGGAVVWPAIAQAYKVNPNEIVVQSPYITHALDSTRWAYSLDKVKIVDFPVQVRPTPQAMKDAEVTLQNMRLWDPEILRQSVDNLQSLRDYFSFRDIDVDRYTIGGSQRMLMLGARDLIVDQLDVSRRNWQNMRLQYTHGSGVVAVPVNEATTAGTPNFLLSDIPPVGAKELEITQPRIYYSDATGLDGSPSDPYVFVRSRQPEFDYAPSGEGRHRWEGEGGVPVGSVWAKLVYASVLGDRDLLFSDDITAETRLLYRRNVRVRAAAVLPYILWDQDPYVTIVNGEIVWILDGYTTANSIPYSAMSQIGDTRLNYVRNAVKFTINAYTGKWVAYVMEPDDPIIRAYRNIYPGLLSDAGAAPAAIRAHFRYPEDLFTLQSLQLALYHQLDPKPEEEARKFYRNEDAWQVPDQTHQEGSAGPMKPYFVQMRLPDEPKDGFLLILPFSPIGRPNMIGWLAAHCDPDDYGRLLLYRFPRDRNINGPAQQEAKFQTDMRLSQQITLIGQVGSSVRHGNLLVVPLGQSVMYVKTLFLVSAQQGIRPLPELKLVVLAFSNKIVFAESYPRALQLLMGDEAGVPASAGSPLEGRLSPDGLSEALRAYEAAQEALRAGDWARYGELQKRLGEILRKGAKAPASGSAPLR
jgi:uncharacterized membrane protein (UPF0182 family)